MAIVDGPSTGLFICIKSVVVPIVGLLSCITTEDGPETGVVIRTEREDEEEAFKRSELGRRGEAVAASSSRFM